MHRPNSTFASLLLIPCFVWGCGSNGTGMDQTDMGGGPPDLAPAVPQIKHVVLIVQENHTFDTYFGRYCSAAAGSNPTCNSGPACCERAPDTEPSGAMPVSLDDPENANYDPDHTQACELAEADSGLMDKYVSGASGCSNAKNFAIAPATTVQQYHDWAGQYALGDRYFQPLSGQSSSNDMYFAVAKWVFKDNDLKPDVSGKGCWAYSLYGTVTELEGMTTIADLLISAGQSFSTYAMGYHDMKTSAICPTSKPADCTSSVPFVTPNPCWYDGSDFPWQYYSQFADKDPYMKDYTQFATDLAASQLPTFSYVKGSSYTDEHPGFGTTISTGAGLAKDVVSAILASPYANDTLILLTWDEGGGFFDHIAPPPNSTVDNQPYGTRVPMLALGRFAKKNYVSHVQMEHSSVVKFLEYNFLGGTGQLNARDKVVNNLGSLLDPAQTGITIPEN